jgi:hypothetical protein
MALSASMRRDQRRRLLAARQRDAAGADGAAADDAQHVAVTAYDDEAHPEKHPAIATRLPVGGGRFFALVSAIVLIFGGAITLAVSGPLFGRPLVAEGGRFARTLAVIAAAFDSRGGMSLQVWLGELALLIAAAIAGAVRLMRRHRRDDYKGRFRAWGWLAWMLVALAAWSVAAVMPWATATPWAAAWFGGEARGAIVAQAAWVAGAGLMLVAMLAAARGVIREVRGLCAAVPARRGKQKRAATEADSNEAEGEDDGEGSQATGGDWTDGSLGEDDDDSAAADDHGDTDFVDGSEAGGRRLSKAERKRLKKLARMNGHAA